MVKVSDIESLRKSYTGKGLVVVVAKDSYDRNEAVKILCCSTEEVRIMHGEGLTVSMLLQELETRSLFSVKNTVIIHEIDKAHKNVIEALTTSINDSMDSMTLVITATALPVTSALLLKAEADGILMRFLEPKPWEKERLMQTWIIHHIAQLNKQITAAASAKLIEIAGTDKQFLASEIEKIVTYVGKRNSITVDDVIQMATETMTKTIWQWRDALLCNDTTTAMRIGKALLNDEPVLQALLANIRSQYQTGYRVADIIENGGTSLDITTAFPYMKGKILENTLSQCQRYGSRRFREGIVLINEADLLSRNSAVDPEQILEILTVKLTIGERL